MKTTIEWTPSSTAAPCPVCGRSKDGDCRISAAGDRILCHYGQTHHPPAGLRRGDVVNGTDGKRWAFNRNSTDNRSAVFKLAKPRESAALCRARPAADSPRHQELVATPPGAAGPITLARLALPHPPPPPEHWPNGHRLDYGADLWVIVRTGPTGKRHIPHHLGEGGRAIPKAGPEPWPLWQEQEAVKYGPGGWIAEAEGEKCCEWLRSAGVVATSQPGHAHTPEAIQARYERLAEADVQGILYLADRGKAGREKAEKCAAAAAAAGLAFRVISAAESPA